MSFLDGPYQDWTRPELRELRDLLVLAYRRPTAAEQLADEAGIVAGTFPLQPNMRLTWTEAVGELLNQGKLKTLVKNAANDPAAGAFQARFKEMLGEQPAVAPPQPGFIAGAWQGDDLAPSVGKRLYPERLLERRNRLIRIEVASAVVAAARSVAKLSLRFGDRRAHGTGFLIGAAMLLTNHHNVVHEQYGAVTSVVAEFDYEQEFRGTPLVRKALVKGIISDAADDWAVIPLEAPVDRPLLKLGTPFDVGTDDTVIIIQHPGGAYKQFALEPLAIRFSDASRIQYVADTQHGSSGSPVFNVHMHVIGLHHAEAEVTVPVDGGTETVWRNEGIHAARVMTLLGERKIKFVMQE
jgi:S1-C subfamily serine protease